MSWLDLLALVLFLWAAIKGYLYGIQQALMNFCRILLAMVFAALLQNSLVFYLNQEWQVETQLVVLLTKNVEYPLKTTVPASITALPFRGPAGKILGIMAPRQEALMVGTMEPAANILAAFLIRLLCFCLIFILFAAIASCFLKIKYHTLKKPVSSGLQKTAGFLLGAFHGLLQAILVCIVLDALSFTSWLRFVQQDVNVSYIYSISNAFLQLLTTILYRK